MLSLQNARRGQDGKQSIGIGKPKHTVTVAQCVELFCQSQSKINGTIWQEASYIRSYSE